MARIKGIDIPNEKHISISLTSVYGIGRKLALTICKDAKVDPAKKAKDLDKKWSKKVVEANRENEIQKKQKEE